MKNEATTATDQAATVAHRGAPVAPEKESPSKKGATQKKNLPKAKKSAQGGKPKAAAPKGREGGAQKQEGRGDRAHEASEGGNAGGDRGSHGLAEAYSAGICEHRWQQGRREDRVLEQRRRRTQLPHCEVGGARQVAPSVCCVVGRHPTQATCCHRSLAKKVQVFLTGDMMSFGIYLVGYLILIIGLAIGAHLMHMPPRWIGVGVLIMVGLGITSAVTATRNRDSST
jgi:hypothetical protein